MPRGMYWFRFIASFAVIVIRSNECKQLSRSPRAFRRKSGGGSFCCVPGCSNESGKDKLIGVRRQYYRFPETTTKQCKLWIIAIKRENFEVRNWHRICSDHFKGGKKGHKPSDPGYIPSIFPFQKEPTPRRTSNSSRPLKSPLREANPVQTPTLRQRKKDHAS